MDAVKLSRTDIINIVWQKTGIEKRDISECYDVFIDTLKEALKRQMTVELRGFGTFFVRIRKPRRNALNPKTRELVEARPHGVCAFRPGADLKAVARHLSAAQEVAASVADDAPPPAPAKAPKQSPATKPVKKARRT